MPIFRLSSNTLTFPPVELAEPDGLLAVGGDLSAERLVAAYAAGIFPWYSAGEPLLWWSPDPRMVLFPHEFHLPRSLARELRRGRWRVSCDQAFPQVITACARARHPHTWITPEMAAAYVRLNQLGIAHSIEVWDPDGQLCGGLYGVALGGGFFGESMFYHHPNASKIALAWLVERLAAAGFDLIDCQQNTPHMARFGAREIPRAEFLALLAPAIAKKIPAELWK